MSTAFLNKLVVKFMDLSLCSLTHLRAAISSVCMHFTLVKKEKEYFYKMLSNVLF
jgi:hypothetical protein